MIELFNIYYFIPIIILIGLTILLYFILKDKDIKTKRMIIELILISNFLLHFLKMLFNPYNVDFLKNINYITLQNICSITIVISPFTFLIKKKESIVHSFMYFIMFLGGFAAFIYPTEALNEKAFSFDVIRFYYCHGVLLTCSILSVLLGICKPKLKHFWAIPLFMLVYELIIFLNELVLFKLDLLSAKTWDVFLDSNSNNNSFTFGPTPDMPGLGKAFTIFAPNFMKTYHNGYVSYTPVIWLIGPLYVYMPILYFIFILPFINFKKSKSMNN